MEQATIKNFSACTGNQKSDSDSSYVYKTENPFSEEERFIYFISDPPHLIKTARNCLSHSYGHGYTRKLWVIYYL